MALEPDVMCIRTKRLEIVTERNVRGAPDPAVEVLLESTQDRDLTVCTGSTRAGSWARTKVA